MSKQDVTGVRTASDLERKYKFGQTFAKMLGLIDDTRDKVDSVESSLSDEIKETTTKLWRDTEQIVMQAKTEMTSEVELVLNSESMNVAVEKVLADGIDEVVTKTGYSFGADGLNISKSGSEIENLIDHSGMYVKKNGNNVLVANNKGVEATDLHAKSYLKIGKDEGRSRFEDYGTNRTACFWIGG